MRLGILCPGQGDLTPAMFTSLSGRPEAEAVFVRAAVLLGRDCRTLPADQLILNRNAQAAVCAYHLAVWAVLRDRLPEACVFAGYSVGELSAWGLAGALSVGDVLRLADRRARLMDQAAEGPGSLMAVRGLTLDMVEPLCADHGCAVAIVNDVDRLVVGGPCAQLTRLSEACEARGAKVTPLAITIASHTPAMAGAVAPFSQDLESVSWRRPSAPVLAGIDGAPLTDPAKARHVLAAQVATRVNWSACLDSLEEMGCDLVLELGPGNGLTRMVLDRWP
jgi:[acyl-carrier-protein] S-malonyltransferase